MKTIFFAGSLVLLALVAFPAFGQTAEETAAKAAEQAGKYQDALQQYTAALAKTREESGDERRLQEAIVRLVPRLSPTPAIPEEARRFGVRGRTWMQEAKNQADFTEAAREFAKALRIAPWWADGYVNQGIALEKAGRYSDAVRSLKMYLLASPSAPDAAKVKDQIYTIEVRQEKAQKEAATRRDAEVAKAAAEQRRRDEEKRAKMRALESLSGIWSDSAMRWRVTISGMNINLEYYDSRNFKTRIWSPDHPCPWNWRGTISENLELSLTMSHPESCRWTPRPPTMSWPVAGRIEFEKKEIHIDEGRSWDFKGQWQKLNPGRLGGPYWSLHPD